MKKWLSWAIFAGVLAFSAVAGGLLGLTGTSLTTKSVTPVPVTKDEKDRQRIEEAFYSNGPIPAGKLKLRLTKGTTGWRTATEAELEDGKLTTLLQDARGLMLALSDTKLPIEEADMLFRTSALKDPYGKAMKNLELAHITISATTWKKIDWGGFDPRNFGIVADRYTLHPLLQKQPLPQPRPDNAAMVGSQTQNQTSGGGSGSGSGQTQGKGQGKG